MLSNQPPVPATAPLTQPAVPGVGTPAAGQQPPVPGQINAAGVQAQISNVGQPINTRKDSTINYEVDRTIRHTKQSVGTIKRLSAAVVVNHRKDAKGIVKPIAEPELKQINDLVREALGFNQERGDSVSVANAPFTAIERSATDTPLWKDPEMLALAKELFKYGAIAAILAYLLFKIIMPLVKTMLQPPPASPTRQLGGNINIVDEEDGQTAPPSAAQALEQKLGQARELAQQDPKVVANIIKDWTGSNAG